MEDNDIQAIQDQIEINEDGGVQIFNVKAKESNFVSMMNELSIEPQDENEQIGNYITETEEKDKKMKIDDIIKLSDDKLYEYLDFEHNVHNWNDFLQPKFPNRTLNEIKTIDVDVNQRTSFFKGREFFSFANFSSTYRDTFEDNFRHQLENCDRLEILNLNIDNNSFWGGVSLTFLETIHEMIPKVLRVVNANDSTSSFYNKDEDFDIGKYLNYVFFLSDLFDLDGTNVIMNPMFNQESPLFIKDVFGYEMNKEIEIDQAYNYYMSSLNALQLQNIYLPLRTKYYGKSQYLRNLMVNDAHLNFMESDLIFKLEEENNKLPVEQKSNGYLMNFSRDFKNNKFSWKKLLQGSFPLNKFSSSITYGYKPSFLLMNEKYEKYLNKISKLIFYSEDQFALPICFPRKYFDVNNSPNYTNKMSILENNRPFIEFSLLYLKNFKKWYKDYDLSVNKYLSHLAQEKYFDYKDRAENIFNLTYTYKDLAENLLNKFDDSDDEDDDID